MITVGHAARLAATAEAAVEHLSEIENSRYAYLSHQLEEINLRMGEFSFLRWETQAILGGIESTLTQGTRHDPTAERLREQNLLLAEIHDHVRFLDPEGPPEPSAPD
jgi:hypothetical protein